MTREELVAAFSAKAAAVNAVVQEVPTMAAALQYVVDACAEKAPAELLADEPGTEQGPLGPNKVPTRVKRVVAAPELNDEDFAQLAKACEEKGFLCLREGLRNYLAGIDVGLSTAVLGVAASGTCLVNTDNEDARLAGMVSEISVILLRKSAIYPDLPSIAQRLRDRMNEAPATYTTLITGPSRTADIERVAAVGVHGPLELHIILLED
ncbi:LutC/YkgG family protein [Desulfovibrio legallii]|jgi:L-lactate dehydrogenase complex protein LldG|uniref:L-lactate dehydrogenase complex protein LldG n=1 Tax=Desulfovibrio legallii TaxID=571438 RepID=A0A1G7HTW4_9BACT|nr:lactate utilization protein [Desulfovibrio legallii]SDF03845.1 L-lactate dehydrogenase complex protein LldG [Desulfovibrio legallii]